MTAFVNVRAMLAISLAVAAVLLAIGLLSASPPGAAVEQTFRAGDANCDDVTNSIDALYILQLEADLIPSVPCPDFSDVSLDGELTSDDALLILQFHAGLFPHFMFAGDGEIMIAALNYRHAGSDARLEDPDLWISYDTIQQQPLVYATVPVDLRLGRVALPARKLTVQGNEGVLLEFTSPPDLARELRLRSVVSWFGPDREFWTVQARDVEVPALIAISNSLRPYVISEAS